MYGYVCKYVKEPMVFSFEGNNGCVCSLSPCDQTTRWEHVGDPVRITGQQEEGILRQMDDRSAGGGRRSRWERDKAFHTDWGESVRFLRVLNRVVLPKHGAGRLRGAACGSPGGHQHSGWGSEEDHLLALTKRGRLSLRMMGNGHISDLSTAG